MKVAMLGKGKAFAVESESVPDRVYVVVLFDRTGQSTCSCPAGTFGQACKHVRRVMDAIAKKEV